MTRRLLARPLTWALLLALTGLAAAGLWWFQPWRLVTNTTVDDALAVPAPPAAAAPSGPGAASPGPGAAPSAPGAPAAAAVVVRQGAFISHEHTTRGTARLVRAPDGWRLELVGLDTSDGPDLRVWLTDRPVVPGLAGWRVFDDGRYVELGRLKGNRGNQVYRLGPGVDPQDFRSVSVWCKRFAVSFGAAPLS